MQFERDDKATVPVVLKDSFAGGGVPYERGATVYCEPAEAKRIIERGQGTAAKVAEKRG